MGNHRRLWVLCAAAGALAAVLVGCTIKDSELPPLTGPSEFGLSLRVTASPDVLTQDGVSRSLIFIDARDVNGQPVRNLALRVEVVVGSVRVDFGQLSAREVVTASTGRAELTYTAPPSTLEPVDDNFTIVSILVTPIGDGFGNAVPRSVSIRLVPPGIIIPPNSTPVPRFTISAPTVEGTPIAFDASTSSDPDGSIVSYAWSFGDGTTGSGVTVRKTYEVGGTYSVTLTVTDDRGLAASTTQTVAVATTADPVARFTFSPTAPITHQEIWFTAEASRAAAGRRIVAYDWNFGTGRTGTGVVVRKIYDTPGIYVVTLTVTDDIGRQGTVSQNVTVSGAPRGVVADFVVSPTDPTTATTIFFDGRVSTTPDPPITEYRWNFGDNSPEELGETRTHAYSAAGSYVVRMRITDRAGNTAIASRTVVVRPATGATVSITVTPSTPTAGNSANYTATATAPTGATVVSFNWNFDGTVKNCPGDITCTGTPPSTISHTFASAGSFQVTVTVQFSNNTTASGSLTVTVR